MRRLTALTLLLSLATAPLTAQDEKPDLVPLPKLLDQGQQAFQSQDWTRAAKLYGQAVRQDADNGLAWHHLGYSLHALGQLDAARKAHEKAATFPDFAAAGTYNVACVHALQGRTDDAIAWLEKAVAHGFADKALLTTDTDMDSVRDDERFAKIVAKLAATPPKVQAYVGTSARESTRLSFWNQQGSPGQIVVSHGTPPWKPEYADAIASGMLDGQRWRLGQDFWTTLDTNLDLSIGNQKVPAGLYYLTLEKRGDEFVLALLDPANVRKHHLDAYLARLTKGGTEVTMKHGTEDEAVETLQIRVKNDPEDLSKAKLAIAFGPHRLAAPITIHW